MGFMLMMGNNNTDIIRYNVSQNDGLAWRHGQEIPVQRATFIIMYFIMMVRTGYSTTATAAVSALGDAYNWCMYNNIYYNYNTEVPSKWGSAETTAESWNNSYLKQAGNLVYEASGIHDPGEIPNAIQADPLFENPGGGESATISEDGMTATSNWESLKAYCRKKVLQQSVMVCMSMSFLHPVRKIKDSGTTLQTEMPRQISSAMLFTTEHLISVLWR